MAKTYAIDSYTHPDINGDKFAEDAFNGEGGFCYRAGRASYVIPFPSESLDDYKDRCRTTIYRNFVRKIVNNYLGYLWRKSPSRKMPDGDDLYSRFLNNADGNETNLNDLLEQYQRLAFLYKSVYIIVDKSAEIAITAADEQLPRLAMRQPSELVNEVLDASGKWLSVTFSEARNNAIVYRTFTENEWSLHWEQDGSGVIERGEHGLGEVPVVRLHAEPPLKQRSSLGESWVKDLIKLNYELFQLCSEVRHLLRSQTFSIFHFPLSSQQDREKLNSDGVEIGSKSVFAYDPTNGGNPPGWTAPPDGPVNSIMNAIAAVIIDIYRVSNLEFVGGVQQAAVALAFHFQEANAALRCSANQCEQAEIAIARLVYKWMGREWEGGITYATDFNLTDLAQAMTQAMESMSLGIGATFDAEIKKRIARQVLGNETMPEVMDEIDKEIMMNGDPMMNKMEMQT